MSAEKRARVLLADDDAMLRRAVARALRRHFEVIEAGGVQEAVAVSHSDGGLDLFVFDLEMKDGDGFEALDRIREHRPDVASRAIIFTGAETDDERLARANDVGCRVVRKAEGVEGLVDALQVILKDHPQKTA